MKNIKTQLAKIKSWQKRIALVVSGWAISCTAFAIGTLPNADNALPDGAADKKESAWDLLFWLIFEGLKLACILVPAVVTIGSVMVIYKSFQEAKDVKGGWGSFAITAGVGVTVTVFAVAMGVLAHSYLS